MATSSGTGAAGSHAEIRQPPGHSFAEVLHQAIEQDGGSLHRIRQRLAERGCPVSLATLSYWRSGRRRPERQSSIDAVVELEDLLDLPVGHLTDRLGPPRRPGPTGQQLDLHELMQPTDHIRGALNELGLEGSSGLAEVSVHYTLDVDAAGRAHTLTMRALHRAVRDGVDRKPIMLSVAEPVGDDVAVFTAVSGCAIGRQAHRSGPGVFAAELMYERPLQVGESVPVEYTVTVPESATGSLFCEYNLVRRIREVMVWVRFSPERVPSRLWTYSWLNDESSETPVDLAGISTVHHAVHGMGPGKVGIRWEW